MFIIRIVHIYYVKIAFWVYERQGFMNKKLFGRFNIIDIILFGIIILALIGAVVRILWNNSVSYEDAEITATFVSENFRPEAARYLYSGAELINEADNSVIGRVVNFDISSDGTLTVKSFAEGSNLKHGIMLGGTTYFVGSEVLIISGDAVFTAYLSDIELVIK